MFDRAGGGGGTGDKGYFNAKSELFLAGLWIFSTTWLWTLLKNWCPPILDAQNSKIKIRWPNETVLGPCKARKLARFLGKMPMSLNWRPQPGPNRAYTYNISF